MNKKQLTAAILLAPSMGLVAAGDSQRQEVPQNLLAQEIRIEIVQKKKKPYNHENQKNAVREAKSYLREGGGFSRDGLINQLKYVGFTQAQAEYGVNAVGL